MALAVLVFSIGAFAQEEFVGPFASWANARTGYGAVGDGTTDDTAALQNALNDLGQPGKADVLYLPAGTYLITSTLVLKYTRNVSVVGQDPSTTIIKWAGPSGAYMMLANGVTQSRWGRITWDGAGVAEAGVAHQWDGTGQNNTTNIEHADEVFQNLKKGIIGGHLNGINDAEVTIIRSKFIQCSVAGISIESFNALDYWIWDSQFIGNARGVANNVAKDPDTGTYTAGGGNFNVYRSLFQNSSVADMTIANTGFFGVRGNTSIGSAQFFQSENEFSNAAHVTMQGNRILDTTTSIAVELRNAGPLMLFDNQIRSAPDASGPAVEINTDAAGCDLISVGNTYTVSSPISNATKQPRTWQQDDQIVPYGQIDGSLPVMPGPLPNLGRQVFEVPANSGSDAIQQAVNQAALLAGQRPVVHLPKGSYSLARTITVPANCDVQIVGDGHGTQLNWAGAGGAYMFQLNGPSKATFRELALYPAGANGTGVANGIEIGNPDQPGSRVHAEGVLMEEVQQNSILAEQLINTEINLHSHEADHSLKAIGPGAGLGSSRVAIFGGTTGNSVSDEVPVFDVANGGRILVEDTWLEGGESRVVNLTDSGVFTYNGGHIAPEGTFVHPIIEVAGFTGTAAFLGLNFDLKTPDTGIQVSSENAGTNLLFMGMEGNFVTGMDGNLHDYFTRLSSGGYLNFVNGKRFIKDVGTVPLPDQGEAQTPEFMRTMLDQLRTTHPGFPVNLPDGVTDVRFYRVQLFHPNIGIHLKSGPVNQPPVVSAGGDQTIVLPALASLNGNATDDGLPRNTLTVAWTQVTGPGSTVFADPSSPRTTASFSAPGTYLLQLRASDTALTSSATVTITVQASPPPPVLGLVAAYSFNEGSGTTVADSSGNGNAGVITGARWTTAGKFGNALVFNGANALVTIKDSRSLHLSAAMTLEAWMLAPAIRSGWQDVIYKGSDNYFLEGTSNRNAVPGGGATFGTDDAVLFGPKPVTPNVWTHLALIYDGTALRLFVNGAQVSSRAHKGAILTSSNPLQIGGDSIYGQFFAGTIDEVRVYNVALSAAQIRTDMNTPVR